MNKNLVLIATLIGLELGQSPVTLAQSITSDESTGTIVNQNGNTFNITGGTLSGNGQNLFHSFAQFGLSPSQIANFLSNPNIVNILSRVTGGNASTINGLIQLTGGSSNLIFINPAGIIFGNQAALNVPASFTATTATGIMFPGGLFNAIGPNNYQNLNGNPQSFVFNEGNSGLIANTSITGELKVNAGQNLSLLGGTVINAGVINAPGGTITIAAVPGSSRVTISQEGQLLSLEFNVPTNELGNPLPFTVASVPELLTTSGIQLPVSPDGTIQVPDSTIPIPTQPGTAILSGVLNTSDANVLGGQITVKAQDVNLYNGNLTATTTLLEATNNITVNAVSDNNPLTINGGNGTITLTADFDNNGQGSFTMNPGDTLQVSTQQLTISGASLSVESINTSSEQNNGGSVTLTANAGSVNVTGEIDTHSLDGNGGAIEITATEDITTGNLSSYAGQEGTGGDITLTAGGNIDTTLGQGYIITLPDPLNQELEVTGINSGSDLGNGGNINITANGNIKTSFIVSGSGENGDGGNIILESFNGTIDATITETVQGESITIGGIASASNLGNSGDVVITAPGDITTGSIITATLGPTPGGNVTIESTQGSVNTAIGSVFTAPSVSLLTNLGVPENIANEAQGITVGLGIFSFSVEGDGGDISITASNNITTSNIVSGSLGDNGGDITLISRNGIIDTSAGIFAKDVPQQFLIDVGLDPELVPIAEALSQQQFGGLLSLSLFGNGGNITLQAPGNITTNYLVSSSFAGQGGSININSTTGSITLGPVLLNLEGVLSSELVQSFNTPLVDGISNQELLEVLLNGGVNSSGFNGGNVNITAPLGVTVSSINAQGNPNGQGGNVNITSERFVRITDTFIDQNGTNSSISTAGGEGGNIIIRHGGNGQTPFVVGNATINGSAGKITNGEFNFVPIESFLYTQERGNIAIISIRKPNLDTVFTSQPPSPPSVEVSTYVSPTITITTLEQTKEILTYIQETTAKIPALIYISFVPPGIVNTTVTNEDLSERERNLSGQYQTALDLNQQTGSSLLSIVPEDDYELEIMLLTEKGEPFRIQLPGVTRKKVLEVAQNFYVEVSNRGDDYKQYAKQLYDWLLKEIEPELMNRKVETVLFFMPSGLRLIPMTALYDQVNQEFVLQKPYTVGLAPSLNLVDYRYKDLKNSPVLAFGASNFTEDQNQTPLPAVNVELPLITEQVRQGEYFINENFTLENVQRQRQSQSYPIVHLATHADFNPDDLNQSYIQLYNQKLTLDQWQKLDLGDPKVDLLVISACNTAKGNPNVDLGFAGLAVQSGAKTVIASLWSVGDTGTLALMDQLYQQLKTAPIKAVALQEAQRAMLNGTVRQEGDQLITPQGKIPLPEAATKTEDDLSHPFYWSAFTLIGSPW